MTSAFTSEDRELDKILRALSDLSKTFKSGAVDPVAVDATLKRAALWAVQKSLLAKSAHWPLPTISPVSLIVVVFWLPLRSN